MKKELSQLTKMEEEKAQVSREEKKDYDHINEVCANCLKWDMFREKCWVFWPGKKVCTKKVSNREEWDEEKRLLG